MRNLGNVFVALFAPSLALLFCMGVAELSGTALSDPAAAFLDRPVGYQHLPWDAEIPYEPKATFVPIFHDGDTSFVTFVVPLWDSVRTGAGRFADSSFGGADLRGTVGIITTNVHPVQTGTSMSLSQVQAIGGRQVYYEIASHGVDEERLGSVGLDASNAKVTIGGVTGRSKAFLQAALSTYQTFAVTNGIPKFRGHIATNWMMTLGEQSVWRANDYKYFSGQAVAVSEDNTNVQAGTSVRQRNADEFAPAVFGRQGTSIYQGFHTIGEPFDPYDVGGQAAFTTASGAGGKAQVESTKVAIDIAYTFGDQFWMAFHEVSNDTAGQTTTCSEGAFRDLTYFLASRVKEGGLEVLTAEQAIDRLRGIRDGELIPHRQFKRRTDFTHKSAMGTGTTANQLTPLGFPVPAANFANFFTAGSDTFVAPGGAATSFQVMDFSTADIVVDSYTNFAIPTRVSYGSADTTGNYVLHTMAGATTGAPLVTVIRTSGCHARLIRVAVQILPINDIGWDQDVYVEGKFGQFEEVFEDNLNSGAASYRVMAELIGGRITAPAFANADAQARDPRTQRVRPQFNFFPGDSTVARVLNDGTLKEQLLYAWAPFTLRPYWISSNGTSEQDLRATYGNTQDLTAVLSTDDDHDANWMGIPASSGSVFPTDHYFYVPVNEHTDYIYCAFQLSATVAPSAAGNYAVLNISAQRMR